MEGIKKLPSMGFGESVKTVLANLTNFNGRARRSELWWYWVAYAVVAIIAGLALSGFPLVLGIISLVLQLSLWAVTVRRLHDRGHSGWWVTAAILIYKSVKQPCFRLDRTGFVHHERNHLRVLRA